VPVSGWTAGCTYVCGRVIVGKPKTWQRRTVPIHEHVLPLLSQACAGKGRDDLVFARPDGRHLPHVAHKSWFYYALNRAGIPRITPHDLRHTVASIAVASGADVKAVQRMLGHESAAMTLDVYADLFDSDLDAVAAAMTARREAALASARSVGRPNRPIAPLVVSTDAVASHPLLNRPGADRGTDRAAETNLVRLRDVTFGL